MNHTFVVSALSEENEETKVCPRCGISYSYIERKKVGSRVYIYAVHYTRVGRVRRVRRCYLGPADRYIYVERIHMLFVLTNLAAQNYIQLAASAIRRTIEALGRSELNVKELRELLRAIEEIGRR